jgi:cytochrome c oxidase subunit 2
MAQGGSNMRLNTSIALLLAIAAGMVIAACSTQQPSQAQQANQTQQTTAPANAATPQEANTAPVPENISTGADALSSHVVEINMTVRKFAFSPGVIHVKQGDRVIIHIVDSDDDHGIAIQGYNQQIKFGSGNEGKTLDFIADKPGTFTFYCNVPCGPGHRDMTGQLIVDAV